jgi:hypothetical protein
MGALLFSLCDHNPSIVKLPFYEGKGCLVRQAIIKLFINKKNKTIYPARKEFRLLMLRLFSFVFAVLAAISALISPLIIVYWLLKITQVPAVLPYLQSLDPYLLPLNQLAAFFVPTPALTVEGRSVPTTEAVVALAFTLAFFLFHFVAELLKVAEQRILVSQESQRQISTLNRLRLATQRQKKILNTQEWQLQLYLRYDFLACPSGAQLIQDSVRQVAAQPLLDTPQALALRFTKLDDAIQCSQQMILTLKKHYTGLRPMDPQPPLFIGLHASNQETQSRVTPETERVASFAGRNQIVFSQTVRALMEAQGLDKTYVFQPIGVYALGEAQQEEMFRLEPGKVINDSF